MRVSTAGLCIFGIIAIVGCSPPIPADPSATTAPLAATTPSIEVSEAVENAGELASPTVGATQTLVEPDRGAVSQWSLLEFELSGPDSEIGEGKENPFSAEVSVRFQGPSGQIYTVPAFYEGDGLGSLNGDVWKVRFSPDQPGRWSFESVGGEFVLQPNAGEFLARSAGGCDDETPGDLPNFTCAGRLQNHGGHYLSFSDGTPWLKGGVDDPEDFLAPGQNAGFGSKRQAVDYLAGHNVNSMYIMLNNVGGDARNVWPWLGRTEGEAVQRHRYFDINRLAEWEGLFRYIQGRGMVLHLVLEDDSGWTGFDRELYYREMVARFGHHNGLIWNLSEEYNENYSPAEVKEHASLLAALDPYDHPITVHHAGGLRNWRPFLADPNLAMTSFQTRREPQNDQAARWYRMAEESQSSLVISFDETGKIGPQHRDLARHILWSVYLGGGNYEIHTSPLRSYEEFEEHLNDIHRARAYVEQFPYCLMQPSNQMVVSGNAYLFGDPETAFIGYLPQGGRVELDLSDSNQSFRLEWFNPRSGETTAGGPIDPEAQVRLEPPFPGDSVLGLRGESGAFSSCR